MKAIVYKEYGSPDVLHVAEVETPTPKDNDVLVKVHAASVNFGDLIARNFKAVTPRTFSMPMPLWLLARIAIGIRKPNKQILGSEFVGEVAEVGKDVTKFKVGESVFGYRADSFGANAEYLCVKENSLIAPKPENMSAVEATAIPYGAMTALNLLKRVNIQPGDKVLINGASGSIGSYMVQFAKYYGAEVTGVCGTPRVEMVKALGADNVIDYKQSDFTQNGETYDLIVDILGKSAFEKCKGSLKPDGRYLLASFKMRNLFQMLRTRFSGGGKRVICAMSFEGIDDLHHVKQLVEDGVLKAIVDRCYPMSQAADAHRYAESGQKKGSVIITIAS